VSRLIGDFVGGLTIPVGAQADVAGEWPMWSDFNKMNETALHKAELLSGLPTLIMLFIAFGAALAAGIPLLLAIAGIATGFASLHMLSWISPMSVWSMNFSMMIGLAVGIDYSLFIVSRYREERVEGKDAIKAIENAMSTSGKAVFLSALTVVLSLSAVFLVPVMVFQTMALGMIISVIAVAFASLTLLPAVLVAMGDKVLVARNKKDPDIVAEGRWAKWTGVSLRRPGLVLTIGLVLLGALIIPSFGMKLGMPGATVVDKGHTSRDGYDMLVAAYGPGAAGPAYVPSTRRTRSRWSMPRWPRRTWSMPEWSPSRPPAVASSSGSSRERRSTTRPRPRWSMICARRCTRRFPMRWWAVRPDRATTSPTCWSIAPRTRSASS
jgi:RND superfamily putative drug exporter